VSVQFSYVARCAPLDKGLQSGGSRRAANVGCLLQLLGV